MWQLWANLKISKHRCFLIFTSQKVWTFEKKWKLAISEMTVDYCKDFFWHPQEVMILFMALLKNRRRFMGCMDADSSRRGSFFYSKNSEGNPSHTCLSTLICLSLSSSKGKKAADFISRCSKKDWEKRRAKRVFEEHDTYCTQPTLI